MPDSNLSRVAAWLAEEERKKRKPEPSPEPTGDGPQPPEEGEDRVFTYTKGGVHSYIQTPNSLMGGEDETDDPTGEVAASLRAQGYRWLPQDDYTGALSQAQQAAEGAFRPPPGKLPFISGLPTHPASKPAFAYEPPRKPSMEEAMAGAASLARPAARPADSPVAKPSPRATLAKARGRRSVDVRMTTEGVQPQLRAPVDPLASRGAVPSLPPRVSTFLQGRRPPSGLEDAQRRASLNQLSANLGRSAEFLGAGVGGTRARPEVFDNLQQQAGQPVEQYQQRRAEDRQQEQDELVLAEAEREAARAAEQMAFQRERATAGDQLARDRLAQEQAALNARLRSEAADRGLRREEMSFRQKEGAELKQQLADQRQQERQAREDELDLQRLGTATSKAPFGEFQAALEDVDRLVPGLAYGQVPAEAPLDFGDRAARALPMGAGDWLMSDKGRAYSTAIANLRDLVSRMRSGAVLNTGEERHYLSLLGDRALSDPRSAAEGINAVRQGIANKLRNAQGGFQNVLPRYEATGATTYRAPIFQSAPPRPTGKTLTRADGSVWQELDNGEAEMIQPPRSGR